MAKKKEETENISDDVKLITPPHVLREKMGHGGIAPAALEQAQTFIDNNDVDFVPYAGSFLDRLNNAIKAARNAHPRDKQVINTLVKPVMELKANGAMFKYGLITELADILLNFLEDLDNLNDDSFEIVDAHYKAISAIIHNRLTGNGGREGKALVNELYSACQRYTKKHGAAEKK